MSIFYKKITILLICTITLALSITAEACSRFTYTAGKNTVVTGRSMDWDENIHTDLWAFPAGMKRVGGTSANSVQWTSKYGSVIASGYNIAATDGINTKGLDANLLFLADAQYGKPVAGRKNLSVLNWLQYVLDNYATVDETVKGLLKNKFNMIAPTLPNGVAATVHLSVTDPTGDNAIFEYTNGQLTIYHGKQYIVMTNEPPYDQQLALNDYWQNLKGVFLPGTSSPEDRFVRASYYLGTAPKSSEIQQSIAIVFSIIRDVSVPLSAKSSSRPNVAPTIWRSVADLKHKVYYFESTDRPNVFWIDLNKLDLKQGAPVKKLPLANNQVYAGDVSKYFVKSKPFRMQ